MSIRQTPLALVFASVLGGLVAGAAGQPVPQSQPSPVTTSEAPPTTHPTTAPAPNPQRSPAAMMKTFLDAARDTVDQPERLAAALACMDWSQVDAEVARAKGIEYVQQLAQIVDDAVVRGSLKLEELPDQPDAEAPVLGEEPFLLVLERHKLGPEEGAADEITQVWRFSASTVIEIPEMHASLVAAMPKTEPVAAREPAAQNAVGDEQGAVNPFRSPRSMMTHFLVALNDAEANPERYADALACMNFANVSSDVVAQQGAAYAEQLGEILETFLDAWPFEDLEPFRLESLPDDPDAKNQTIGRDPLQIILARGDDGRWQFAARTVAQIPDMHKKRNKPLTTPGAEGQPVKPPPETTATVATDVPVEYRSPRATMETFLKAMTDNDLRGAVRCLDLSGLREVEREASAPVLAGKLLLVMNRAKVVVYQEISDDPNAEGPFKFLLNRYGRIEIGRQAGGERNREWLFTAATVSSIERLYEAWESRPLLPEFRDDVGVSLNTLPSLWLRENIIPRHLKRTGLWLQHWQWLGIAIVLLVGWLAQRIAKLLLPWLAGRILRVKGREEPFEIEVSVLRPAAILILVAIWWGGLQLLDLGARLSSVLWPAMRFVMVVAGVWTAYRVIDVLTAYFTIVARRSKSRLDDVLVPLARTTLKVVVVAVGIVLILKALGFRVEPLLAGFGIGGLAFSFAAKDTIANFFGSVNVVLDRPFQVNDWVKIGDVEGTVEAVGLRSSRIRTFYNSQVTVPNAELMTARIDNMGRRRYRRISTAISVTYGTRPEQLEAFCEGIREIIREHPYTRKDYFHVYVNKFAASSIDIMLYCFHECPDWGIELRERHRLFLDIIRVANSLGVEFAFPTQTIHLHSDDQAPTGSEIPPVPRDPEQAMAFGREQADAIVKEFLGGEES